MKTFAKNIGSIDFLMEVNDNRNFEHLGLPMQTSVKTLHIFKTY